MAELAEKHGFKLQELMGGRGKGKMTAPKYANPEDPSQTWTGRGRKPNWLVAKLIQGEKLVTAQASIRSSNGQATVHIIRVEIGGLAVTGAPLDFLVQNFLLPFYPDAKIDEPFDLAANVDRIVVTPAEALVYLRR